MGNNSHRFILGVDDELKQKLAGQWAREFAGGAILELAFVIPDIWEMTQNPYLNNEQKFIQGIALGAGALSSAGMGAGAAILVAGAPVVVVFGVGVVAGVVTSYAWDAIAPPVISWIYVASGREDPYQNNRHLKVVN
ncbi:MAG: hypothetical protein OT477_14070 [Chloroflexi bacterium]|nr:hypothetical protein [Chloroflexota bacterium]